MKNDENSSPVIETCQSTLDPEDWQAYRSLLHQVLDQCVDRMESATNSPWVAPGSEVVQATALPELGTDMSVVAKMLVENVMPYSTGNTHPRFFGWVHGSGLASDLLSAMVEATMNSNCGGRDHGAVYIERQVIEWCLKIFDWPATGVSGGILTTGTSMATLIAFSAARTHLLGKSSRQSGIKESSEMCVYAAQGVHNCVHKALDVMGIGSTALREISIDPTTGSICLHELANTIVKDRNHGFIPLCVVGCAGTVDTGRFDSLNELADFCNHSDIWFHIDGAYGAWLKLAEPRWAQLVTGIEKADSLAFDFHKWMYVQYDVGAVLIRNKQCLLDAFGDRPAYLKGDTHGLAGGDPWYCEQGLELSRGFRALKVWTALQVYGTDSFGRQISKNCEQAAMMSKLVQQSPALELASPVTANVCCFRVSKKELSNKTLEELHNAIATRLQYDGSAVLSTTMVDGRSTLRAAIVNHRTQKTDIKLTIDAVVKAIR